VERREPVDRPSRTDAWATTAVTDQTTVLYVLTTQFCATLAAFVGAVGVFHIQTPSLVLQSRIVTRNAHRC
jgi:hypothetical protein